MAQPAKPVEIESETGVDISDAGSTAVDTAQYLASQAQKVEKNSESLGETKIADYWDEEGTPADQAEAALSDVSVKPPLAPKQMAAIKKAQQPKETLDSDLHSSSIL